MTDPLRYFRIEAGELVEQLSQGVLDLDSSRDDRRPNHELVARLLRHAHTLKGAARVVRENEIADRAHAFEEVLVPYRDGSPPPDATARLLHLVDDIGELVAALGTAAPPPEAPPEAPPEPSRELPPDPDPGHRRAATTLGACSPPPKSGSGCARPVEVTQHARVDANDVDELLDAVGEAYARFAPLRNGTAAVEHVRRTAEALVDQLRTRASPAMPGAGGSGAAGSGVAGRLGDTTSATAARLVADLAALGRQLTDRAAQVERELDEVRGRAERLRLVSAGSIFTSLHRAVRDAADAEGKRVAFEGRGGELRLDPNVLAQASSALLHVVRNAVAHGVEPEADRVAAGKPPEGRVVVDVARHNKYAVFRCRDDGRGIDLDAVRRAAKARGITPGDDSRQLLDLLVRGGISTAGTVTSVSGRGIGLDVVRDVAEQLGGELSLTTEPGVGTTVELAVPLSAVSLHGVVVAAGGAQASIPIDTVRTCVRLNAAEVAQATSTGTIPHAGEVIPFLPLAGVLVPEAPAETRPTTGAAVAVIVSAGAATVAVSVDRLVDTSTLVVRPLPALAPANPLIGGLSLDAEGNPRVVLDPHGLVAEALRGSPNGTSAAGPGSTEAGRPPVLVIDDSLTTRMLERSILETAGYEVDLAASGEEGLERARQRPYALYLVDIDMPGIDGFTFIEQTRTDPALRDVPAILVSSRTAEEDRERGAQVGAGAYVVKGEFNQGELLGHIRRLVS